MIIKNKHIMCLTDLLSYHNAAVNSQPAASKTEIKISFIPKLFTIKILQA